MYDMENLIFNHIEVKNKDMRNEEMILLNLIKADEFDAAKAVVTQATAQISGDDGVELDVDACDGIIVYNAHLKENDELVKFLFENGAGLDTQAAKLIFQDAALAGKEDVVDVILAQPNAAKFLKTVDFGAMEELGVFAKGYQTRENRVYKGIRKKIEAKMQDNMAEFNAHAKVRLQKPEQPKKRRKNGRSNGM